MVCPPTPTKTPTSIKNKSSKKKKTPSVMSSPLFNNGVLGYDENATASPYAKKRPVPSPAAKRKFANFQKSIGQSPQLSQPAHHFHNHQHFETDGAPRVPVTPMKP